MKKTYIKPEADITRFDTEDIMTASGGLNTDTGTTPTGLELDAEARREPMTEL